MLLRRHKINAARQSENVTADSVRQDMVYGNELDYEPEIDKFSGSSKYTKTMINRMSTSDLQSLAKEQEIENADEISGSELKKMLIEKFCL